MRVQEGISPEIVARRVSERRGEERDDRRGRVAVRQERERPSASRVRRKNGSARAIGLAGMAVLGGGREVGRGGVLGRSEIGRGVKRPSGRALLGCGG